MNVLLTGATGFIGSHLLPRLLAAGHKVFALARSPGNLPKDPQIVPLYGDLTDAASLSSIPAEIDAAYYLVHSMSASALHFPELESLSAEHFCRQMAQTRAKQIIYLSGLINEAPLSRHLASRQRVDTILRSGKIPVTTLKASIIIGRGSASLQILSDLVEKLPIMIAPRWILQKTQPISLEDVLEYLCLVLSHPQCLGRSFDIGGPDILSYKDMLLTYARLRHLKRRIYTVPILTPRLSAYWLYFVTSASFPLARSLTESLRNNVLCKDSSIQEPFPRKLLSYEEALLNCLP